MDRWRRLVASAVVAACAWVTPTMVAQDGASEVQKLLAKRAAEADAYRKLAEAVYGLQINSTTRVRDFVVESDQIKGDVDTFVRGIRLGEPVYLEDGSCEVPAEVTVAKVIQTIRDAHSTAYKGDDVKTSDFSTLQEKTAKDVLKVVGQGVPRPDLPPGLPIGAAEMLGPPPAGAKGGIPAIWLRIGPQARLLALRAARTDAQRRLAERIKGLRVNSSTRVRDFMVESDTILTDLNTSLIGAQEKSTYLHDRELIAEVTLVVPTEQVITAVKEIYSRQYKGDDVKGHDLEQRLRSVISRDFEATGMGVPPPQFIQKFNAALAAAPSQAGPTGPAFVPVPDWAGGNLEAEGRGTDAEFASPQGRLRAQRAAEMDAKRKLAEAIAGLQVGARKMQDLTGEHQETITLMDGVISDALITDVRFADSTAIVTVTIPGMRVWAVVNDFVTVDSK